MKSNLQIISGKHHGKKLFLPSCARPTQNLAREALFNILGTELMDFTTKYYIWDAFAGSGALGLECISRYNNPSVFFTDVCVESINTIKKNLLLIQENAVVDKINAIEAIEKYAPKSDLIFVDPPYSEHKIGCSFITKIASLVKTGCVVVWETDKTNIVNLDNNVWNIYKTKQYGRAYFTILIKK